MSSYKLNQEWNLWFHSIQETNWGKESYRKLITFKSLYDYQYIIDTFKQNHYQNGMFFFMKENIFPNWEDPSNRNGSCLSFKVPSKYIISEWNQLLLDCLNNTILKEKNEEINGISISPKKEFNIIKIWFSKKENYDFQSLFTVKSNHLLLEKSVFKAHSI
tara:strand:- start:1679 stop:2161 length:483 start_codon:yes stop_codon:yes gene_type:complete